MTPHGRAGTGSGRGRAGGGETTAADIHGGVQAADPEGGRRLHDGGSGRGVVAAGGVVLVAPGDLAPGAEANLKTLDLGHIGLTSLAGLAFELPSTADQRRHRIQILPRLIR